MTTDQGSLLDLIANDVTHEGDAARVRAAILNDGACNYGLVNPNRVRKALSNSEGLDVYPRVVGAVYSAMRREGLIKPAEYVTSDDTNGGNSGKPARTYHLTYDGWGASPRGGA